MLIHRLPRTLYYSPANVLAPWLGGGSGNARPVTGESVPSGDLDSLASRVIAGEFGNGDERKRRLGTNYAAVQAIVNRKLGY